MNNAKRSLANLLLGVVTCVLLIGFSTTPTLSRLVTPAAMPPGSGGDTSAVMAQGMSNQMMQRYAAPLINASVVPNAPSTPAMGVAEASLMGNRLTVRGSFMGLSSPLRDYAIDPVNPPNPKITSAVHIHRGDNTQNGPFQYALTVMRDQTGMGGKFSGDYTLTSEQLQALTTGKLYVDIHTKQNRAGELRGIFRPL
ncbi:CHRD domain-containing protein [Pantanalinema sp. GBBB05]|uniref:CHRD domain-containing protein n=1 Tax=Pantanalinema sp. GBBB05 TaxID=2604139 RepID=UPI001DAC6A0C|nr:CHRD domain-containing protein [Pantanalinema sp. GBBB05]